ncbi:cytochrome c-type biogenesis protein [Mesobacterium sp. TK19101]|uniref:Cytochrome c-type biogenesis protein n=1 Tax=Mesobacterium hydrothermale TaxID=3111907 RepID=A0ABU6HDA8_9RHOB|nr:cytochrome c-type biogenesis protein [Mesobacterium sp. TK19101]MEC3860448.1 cytochrome c-type biogenesis protein [Mesobacterium sp. TK19101]
MKRFLGWWAKHPPYALALILALLAAPVAAVQPDEMLQDPTQEARAREISKGLRCLVCQNENIDDSNASLARDLRILVRERITAGDDNAEVVDYIVDRYGEFVLLKPTSGGANWLLWASGPILFVLGLLVAGLYIRRRSTAQAVTEQRLSPEEQTRLQELLRD